jgi:O-antigen/teichoic acid export membrane protein
MVLIPMMFRSHKEAPDRLERLYRVNLRMTGLAVLPLTAVIALYAPEIIGRLYGEGYAASRTILRILAFALPFSFLSVALGDQLTARDRQARRVWIHGIIVGIGLSAHAILASLYGPVGSAVAAVTAELFLFILLLLGVRAGVASIAPLLGLARPIGCVAIATVATLLLQPEAQILVGLLLYCTAYIASVFLLRAVRLDEVQRLIGDFLGRGTAGEPGAEPPSRA